jgi:predicted GIY-YIG superfamily endonuclease
VYGSIYLITNSVNGKVYVGQTTKTLQQRWAGHVYANDPKAGGFWLHDCAAFATYLCTDTKCAAATTLWNQG